MKTGSDQSACNDGMPTESLGIVYDGDCPFCSWYVDRLRDAYDLRIIDARTRTDVVEQLDVMAIDVDRDMVLLEQGQVYQGAEALYRLARQTGDGPAHRNRGFNLLHRVVFRSRPLAKVLYSVLRSLRLLYLRLTGRSTIHASVKS